MTEPKWCVQRGDGRYYAGTVDKKPVYRDEPTRGGAFTDKDTAIVRCESLDAHDPSNEYRVEKVFI